MTVLSVALRSPPRTLAAKDAAVVVNSTAVTMTEDSIARVFAAQFGGRLLFDHTAKRWLQWDGARWKPEQTGLAFDFARELVRGLNRDGQAKWAKAAVFASVETIARSDRCFARTLDQFDSDPWLLGTPGGIVDLRSGALLPADPAAMMTRNTTVTPAAGEPTRWLTFLRESTGNDAEVIHFLQQFFGYCLTGATTEHLLVFFYGPGGNGKGVTVNVLSRILGDYAQSADIRTFTVNRHDRHPTELAALRGARMVTAAETEASAEWAASRIKALTGGDTVRARFMRADEFEYRPQFKLVIVGNYRPRLRDVGDGMRRRLRMVPFEHTPSIINAYLESELMHEAGQILNWMISGCLDWQRNGLITPAAVQAATTDYFEAQDTLADWLAEKCELGSDYCQLSAPLFHSWSDYCRQAGDDPGTQVRFADAMKRRGLAQRRTRSGILWQGIRINRQFEPHMNGESR